MTTIRRMAVLPGSSLRWRGEILQGIRRFVAETQETHPWQVCSTSEEEDDAAFLCEHFQWDGLLVGPSGLRQLRRILNLGVPVVCIGSALPPIGGIPRVSVDDGLLAGHAARHLISSGLRHFAYCNTGSSELREERGRAFVDVLRRQGYPCEVFATPASDRRRPWRGRLRQLSRWIARLPDPVGIFAWNADVACQLVEASHQAGRVVPDQVAILSANEDEFKTLLTRPTISALEFPAEQLGYQAAALLAQLVDEGKAAPREPIRIAPSGALLLRDSTRRLNDLQQEVQKMRQWMAERLALGISDLVGAWHCSRATLERHFREVLGHSPHEEWMHLRLEKAQFYLRDTRWPSWRIATACGFSSGSYFQQVFKARLAMTPGEYRRSKALLPVA